MKVFDKKPLFEHNGKKFSIFDIKQNISETGITKGDILLVHSDLGHFGKICQGTTKEEFLQAFIDAFREAVGNEGTIIMPTFSYTFCKKETFDVINTKSETGLLTEYFRKMKGVERTVNPLFSFAVEGKDKEYFLDIDKTSFGANSVFAKLVKKRGKVIFLGETFDLTFMHHVEFSLNVPYRYSKTFSGIIKTNEKQYNDTYEYYVRDDDVSYDYEKIESHFRRKNLLKTAILGYSKITAINAEDAFDEIKNTVSGDTFFLLKSKPKIDIGARKINVMDIINDLYMEKRYIISEGIDSSFAYLSKIIPMKIHEFPSGKKCWTWTIPKKWNVKEAWIKDSKGNKILDVKDNPLHVIGSSLPINKTVTKEELMEHLHTSTKRPNAVPWAFRYYDRDWGFCIEHNKLNKFADKNYHVFIDSKDESGTLKVGEINIKGENDNTIFLVAHLCHPCQANDDLSSVALLMRVAYDLLKKKNKYTYKILILPETIGSVAYLSNNENLIEKTDYGIFLEMLGNNNTHALQLTRQGNTKLDRIARYVLKNSVLEFREGQFGRIIENDELVFNGPGVNIPMISISRFPYQEYHTSDDNLSIIDKDRLEESRTIVLRIIGILERDYIPKRRFKGRPFVNEYGYFLDVLGGFQNFYQFIVLLEGDKSIFDIADEMNIDFEKALECADKLYQQGLIEKLSI